MKQPPRANRTGSFKPINDSLADDHRPPITNEQLVQQIKETADKLIRDGAERGDVKLLNTTLKELRYAFKVFAPIVRAGR